MTKQKVAGYLIKVAILFAAYFITARIGLSFEAVSGFATFVWPPSGIALAALLLFGSRLWPGIFLAAFFTNYSIGASLLIALGIAVGNTLSPLVGTYLFRKIANFNNLERLRCALALIVVSFFSTMISATVGTTSLLSGGTISLAGYSDTWAAWWIGDTLGILLVGSLLLINWKEILGSKLNYRTLLHFFAIELTLILASLAAFWGSFDASPILVFYFIFSPLIWAALRFGQGGGVVAIFSMTTIAIWGVVGGYGPFAEGSVSDNLSAVQTFMGSVAINILLLGAVVSERRYALENLQKSNIDIEQEEAKYEALLESIGDGVIAIDGGGRIIYINDKAVIMLGLNIDDARGKNWAEIIQMEDEGGNKVPPKDRLIINTIKTGTTSSSSEYYYVSSRGERFPVQIKVSPIILGKKTIGAISIFRDITEQKELDRAKSEFISIASHQLRTPVTATRWLTELFKESANKLNQKERGYLNDLSASVERMSRLVEDLLNVSRIELGTIKPDKVDIDLASFIEDFTKDIQPYAILKKHKIVLKKEIDSLKVLMDSKILYNVLQNLISNAIDYSPADTTVTINITKEEDEARVSISNQGQPIPRNEQVNLFQKFYRGESTKKMKTDGTGLGLYIFKSNVEAAGGKVGFKSEKGEETSFWFTLPLKK